MNRPALIPSLCSTETHIYIFGMHQQERLEARLRNTLAGRLRLALNNATGYTLDDLDDEGDDDDNSGFGETLNLRVPSGLMGTIWGHPHTWILY